MGACATEHGQDNVIKLIIQNPPLLPEWLACAVARL